MDAPQVVWNIWEGSAAYYEQERAFVREFEEISDLLVARGGPKLYGSPEPHRDGFHIWSKHEVISIYERRGLSKDEAMALSLRHLENNWYRLDDLRAFAVDPENSLAYRANMWAFGFRPSTSRTTKWARRRHSDVQSSELGARPIAYAALLNRNELGTTYRPRLVQENVPRRHGTSWSLTAAGGAWAGMLYFSFDVSPFTPDMRVLASGMSRRFHFSIQQAGFTLTGRNVRVVDEHDASASATYVEVTIKRGDETIVELWPSVFTDQFACQSILNEQVLLSTLTSNSYR